MVSQYSRSLIGKHDSSIFDLDPEVVKFTRHKSVRVGISEEVSLIVRPETKLIYFKGIDNRSGYGLWQHGLWSFQAGDSKLKILA